MKLIQSLNSPRESGRISSVRLWFGLCLLMFWQPTPLPLQAACGDNCAAPVFIFREIPPPHILTFCSPSATIYIGTVGCIPSYRVDAISWSKEGSASGYCDLIEDPNDPPGKAWSATLILVDPDAKSGTVTVKAVPTPIATGCTNADWPAQTLTMDFDVVVDEAGCSSCSGGGGGGGDGGGRKCGSCTANNNNGPDVQLSLGMYDRDYSSGFLWLSGHTPSSSLASPSALQVPYKRANVTVIPSTGTIEQVKAPQGLARVVDSNPNDSQYDLEFYYGADVYWDGSRWQPNVGASPFVKWTVANPGGNVNVLQISEYHGQTLGQQFTYTYDTGTSKWSLTDADNIRTIVSWETVNSGVTDQ